MLFLFYFHKGWQDVVKLSADFPDSFADLVDNIARNLEEWQEVSCNSYSI